MRKLIAVVVIAVALGAGCVWADEGSKMTFDNVTFGKAYKIKGYASITLLGFKFIEAFAQWEDGRASKRIDERKVWEEPNQVNVYISKNFAGHYASASFRASGNEAEFAWLKADVTNLQKAEANFMKDITVKVIYDDEYQYDGWVRQFNYDYSKSEVYRYKETSPVGWPVCLSPSDEMSIAPMYKGHYAFGCTLPNAAVEDKDSPLRMEITIGDHKLTYNIR